MQYWDGGYKVYCLKSGRLAQLAEQLTLNQRVTGSSPVSPNTQASKNKAVTKSASKGGKSQDGNLAEILFSDAEIEQDLKRFIRDWPKFSGELRQVIWAWPKLPEHIKAAVKALIDTVEATREQIKRKS